VSGTNGDQAALIDLAQSLEELRLTDASLKLQKEAVVLNWLSGAGANVPIGTGGPGNWPRPFEGTSTQLATLAANPPAFENLKGLPGADKESVEVFVLDTAWPEADLAQALTQRAPDSHSLVTRLFGPGGRLLDPAGKPNIQYMTPADRNRLTPIYVKGHDYRMRDHGLFAAGIISTIAPKAKLTLIEVLNEYGIGDLSTIGGALSQISGRSGGRSVIINCSLMLNIPYDPSHDWHKEMLDVFGSRVKAKWLKDQAVPLQLICDQLAAQGHQVVAAAGNEGDKTKRPPARYPAAFESVVGVGASHPQVIQPKRGDKDSSSVDASASYSNLSDFPTLAGTVTLGGGDDPNNENDRPILGIYLGEFPHIDDPNQTDPNRNGWAYWSGTSFATPIVSGRLAATLGDMGPGARATDTLDDAKRDKVPGRPQNSLVEPGRVLEKVTNQNEALLWTRQEHP
jgi:hypothetical protein